MWVVPSSIRSRYAAESPCSTSPAISQPSSLDGDAALSLTVSGTHSQRPASWPGWKKRAWSLPLFGGVICETSTPGRFADWWTSSLRACRASRTASPVNNSDTTTSAATEPDADRSRNSCESSPSVSPPWCSSKTSLPGLLADGFDLSERSYADWVTRSKSLSSSLLRRLARVTDASESSSSRTAWPTVRSHEVGEYQNQATGPPQPTLTGSAQQWCSPGAMGGGSVSRGGDRVDEPLLAGQVQQWATPRAEERMQTNSQDDYVALSKQTSLWPSPRSEDSESCGNHPDATDSLTGATKLWTTPQAHDATGAASEQSKAKRRAANSKPGCCDLTSDVANFQSSLPAPVPTGAESQNTCTRRLNPAFVCWLMGVPWFWTRAEVISCAALEMVAYHSKLRSLLSSLCGER